MAKVKVPRSERNAPSPDNRPIIQYVALIAFLLIVGVVIYFATCNGGSPNKRVEDESELKEALATKKKKEKVITTASSQESSGKKKPIVEIISEDGYEVFVHNGAYKFSIKNLEEEAIVKWDDISKPAEAKTNLTFNRKGDVNIRVIDGFGNSFATKTVEVIDDPKIVLGRTKINRGTSFTIKVRIMPEGGKLCYKPNGRCFDNVPSSYKIDKSGIYDWYIKYKDKELDPSRVNKTIEVR